MKHRILPIIFVGLSLLQSGYVYGGIEVTLDNLHPTIEDTSPWFVIWTGYTRYGIHHNEGHHVETRLIKAGKTSKIPVNFLNPLLFYKTNIQLYHPAYLSAGDSAKKMPTIIRTVSFGPFELKSWRSVLDSGRPIAKHGPQPSVGAIVDHIRLFADTYIYEIDKAGKEVDLSTYLLLMQELIAYAKKTAPSQRYSKSIEDEIKRNPEYANRLKRSLEGKFKLADSYIARAEAMLKLTPEEMVKLRYYQEHIVKIKLIYYDIMDDSDKGILLDFVENQFALRPSRNNSANENTRLWMNPETGISYSASYKSSYRMRVGETDTYVSCIRLDLSVDLSTSIPVEMPPIWGKKSRMENSVLAKFCNHDGVKRLQLTRREAR